MLANLFSTNPKRLFEMHSDYARYILAARSWCLLRNTPSGALQRLETYLSCSKRALRFSLLMETVTQIWPEPFAIHRLCCGKATVDEELLIHAIRLAHFQSRPRFDRLLNEMLPAGSRDLLFAHARALVS